ncbi:dTDP-4-dehydrorhamnose reductase [Ruegeria arenilitoris]|uniref:dTDP-4-dehydrorhamnose reductase n=1 Tax=Ruegeria arenilitoris TaxID=1173585 RepID=UPI00147F4002|nr:dTDP-4-dehydrorhamnose reductase [Ruegeria arenilitoris]
MILAFGQTGQVAQELASYRGVVCLDRLEAGLSKPETCATAIHARKPQAVINAAAYTAVDGAEEEEALATLINGEASGTMAQDCTELGISLVRISTDYVFNGAGESPWMPGDATEPLGAYGRSKLKGEQAVTGAGGCHAILRTSWVVSAHGANFVKTMLRLGKERDRLTIVADQIGGPTPARTIAGAYMEIARQLVDDPGKTGTCHFSGAPDVSWAGFAREIFAQAAIDCEVVDIPSVEYPTPARRPLNSRLDCSSLETVFGTLRPDWPQGLTDTLKDLGEI